LCTVLFAPSLAHADWKRWSEGDAIYLNAISAPDLQHVFVAGDAVEASGMSFVSHPHVYASTDRGHTFTEISGSLSHLSGVNSASAIAFVDSQTGWVAVGNNIFRTTNGGAGWTPCNVGQGTTAMHAFDAMNVARVGRNSSASVTTNGGAAWTPGSGVDLGLTFVSLFWLDRQHGWASSNMVDEYGIATQAQLFRTTDGGSTWTQTWNQSNHGAGPVFFLPDGQTGWVATYEQSGAASDPPDPYPAKAHLFKTTNGGDDFTDIGLPTQVGTFEGLFNSMTPIDLTRIYAMHWDDAQHGHLVGGAFQGSSTSGMSGGMTSTSQTVTSWRVADYRTTDGTTWNDRTNLGTITASTTLPPSDGQFTTGYMADSENGWLVADNQAVWGYESTCTAKGACASGYTCVDGHCVDESSPASHPDGGTTAGGTDGGGFTLGGRTENKVRAGCQCGEAGPATLLFLPLLALRLVRRRSAKTS
jgi:hypothetical protein